MAQFSYDSYAQQQATRRANSSANGKTGEKTRFVNE